MEDTMSRQVSRQSEKGMDQLSCPSPLSFRLRPLDVRGVVEVEEHKPRGQAVQS